MSKVFDVLKKVPGAIRDVESDLPRSEQGIRDFPGKGLLTALVDTSGSELKRQREMEDGIKSSMVKPLIEKYWMGNLADDERDAIATQIKSILGGGKQTKAFLDKMFEVGGQIHGVNKILMPPPGAADEAANQAVQVSKQEQDQETGAPGQPADILMRPPTSGSPAPIIQPPLAQPPKPVQPPLLPPPVAGSPAPMLEPPIPSPGAPPAPTPPLSSALTKMFPPGLGEEEKLRIQHENKLAEDKATSDARMAELQAGIEAGRYDKATASLTRVTGVEVDPETGKNMRVTHWYDPKTGVEVKKDIHGQAPGTWASKPTRAFIMKDGKITSVLIDPFTNQSVPGSERADVVPPAALMPRISEHDYAVLDDDGNLVTIPLRSTTGRVLPNQDMSNAQPVQPAGQPATQPTGQPIPDAIVNYVMSRPENRGNTREATINALQNTPPETLELLRQQAAQSGILTAPPGASAQPSPGTPPATLPGGPGGAGAGGTGSPIAVSSPQAPMPGAQPSPLAPPQLERRSFQDVLPPGQWNLSKQREIPVREAYTQMVGAPEFPDAPSMLSYASIADDPARREKLAKALKLTFDGLNQAEKAHGSLVNLLKLRVGIPLEEINSQVATYAAGIGDTLKDDPELQDAYNQTMAVFGTAVGLRSLTRASSAQASVQKIENELPLIGLNSFSSRDVQSKLSRLMMEVYNGAKNTPTVPKSEQQWIRAKVDELNQLARGSRINPPPGARQRQGPELPGNAGRIRVRIGNQTGTIDESEFDPATMERVGQ